MKYLHKLGSAQAAHPVKWVALAAMGLALSACSTHGDIQGRLSALESGKLGLQQATLAEVDAAPQAWWTGYGDRQLASLIERALADNPSIQVAQTRWQRVQAQAVAVQGEHEAKLQASGEIDRQHFTAHGLYPYPVAGASLTSGTAQLAGSWELDLFGRQRAEIDSSIGQAKAASADLHAARLLLSTQVARTYVQLGRLQSQRAVAQRTLSQREEMLALVKQRVQAGLDTKVELKQADGALPETRVQLEALDEQIALTRHALAVLTGQAPNALDGLTVTLDALPVQQAPDNVPADLLARRADVMAARWRVESSGFEVDAARALFYPNVNLTSYAGYNAIGLENLFKPASWQWGLMPAVHLPLFDGQQRRANLMGKVAEQDAAIATYNQAVLQAAQDVTDLLASGQSLTRQQREQQAARASIETAYDLAMQRYRAGMGTYLIVLNAESSVLNQRRLAIDLQARVLDSQFALYRALGGSLQTTAASPAPVSSSSPQTIQTRGDRT